MGLFFYNLLIIATYFILFVSKFFNKKLNQFYLTRKQGYQEIQNFFNLYTEGKKIWLHASSMGELEQALALFRIIKQKQKDVKILITVFSLSVKNIHKIPSEGKAYLPLDLPWQWNFKNFNVDIFITFTWDTFPNLLRKLKKIRCKNFMNSAAISSDSYRIKKNYIFKFFYQNFDKIGVVDEENYKNFLNLVEKEKLYITGDSRYDSIFYKLENLKLDKEIQRKINLAKQIVILASTYQQCDLEIYPHLHKILNHHPSVKIWIFPHHINQERILETSTLLKKYNLKFLIFSDPQFIEKYPSYKIILVDVLGILAFAYQKSRICYVGGGFHHRIHNTGEPAACGCIPVTGPGIDSSPTAMLLYKNSLLKRCETGLEIINHIDELLKNKNQLNSLSRKIKELMQKQKGASEIFYNTFLKNLL